MSIYCIYIFSRRIWVFGNLYSDLFQSGQILKFSIFNVFFFFPNNNYCKDKRLKKYLLCLSPRSSSFFGIIHSSSIASASNYKKWIIVYIWNLYLYFCMNNLLLGDELEHNCPVNISEILYSSFKLLVNTNLIYLKVEN